MLIESEDYKKRLEEFYARFMPCGEPTYYEQGFMDGLSYAIKSLKFCPEAEMPKQLVFAAFMEDLEQ